MPLLATSETDQPTKMLATMEFWEEETGRHTDNTDKFLCILLFKLALDTSVFYLCCRQVYTSFLSMCSLSIIVADSVLVFLIASVWFLGAERSFVSACFLLANASGTYGALVLPMTALGLLDYCFWDTFFCNQRSSCKILLNLVLTLLLWMLAIFHSFVSVKTELMELNQLYGTNSLVCEVQESHWISYFIIGISTILIFAMLPFLPRIPQWIKEANRLSKARVEQNNQRSDLLFITANSTESKSIEYKYAEETSFPRPSLCVSMTMGFGVFWIPYLTTSVICLILDFAVPAYITVNLLWLECINSLLVGVVFWLNRKKQGPYSRLPETVCLWPVFWYLSEAPQQHKLHFGVFNPSQGKRNTLFYV